MQSFRYVSLLCFVGISILILGLFSPPTLSDDLLYHFSFLHLDDSQLYPIQRLFDLLPSQIAHYDTVNGRSVVHGLGQFFLCLTPLMATSFRQCIVVRAVSSSLCGVC